MANQTFTVQTNSKGLKTDVKAGEHNLIIDEPQSMGGTNEGADPLSTLLGSLAGCETVVANLAAKELDFDLQSIDFEIDGSLDPRGLMGTADVQPYFQTVNIEAKVHTSETQERVDELQKLTDARCPVYTSLEAAGIEMNANWVKA